MLSTYPVFRISGLFVLAAAVSGWAAEAPSHVPGRLLAAPREGIDSKILDYTLKIHGAVVRKHWTGIAAGVLEVPEESSQAIMESLQRTGAFEYVERDPYAHTAGFPNDPGFASQWYLPKIQTPQAWMLTTGSPSITVAVIDSGVFAAHPDLSSNVVPGWNFLKSNGDTSDVEGHGTAVAGVIAAATDNAIGVAGVSWQSRILPLVVVDSNGQAAYSDIAAAIQYAADRGVRVINMSIGGTAQSLTLQSAVNYAWSKGALLFAAAMNNGNSDAYYPAACSHVIAVTATESNDRLASFANYGNWVTIAAPGDSILTTTNGGGYAYWFGTSFASPIVAGVAALSLAIDPSLTNTKLMTILEETADGIGSFGYGSSFAWGRVNAYSAVSAARRALIESSPGAHIPALRRSGHP